MRRFFKISALILVYFLGTAKSCNDGEQADSIHEQDVIKATKDSITSAFASDSLPAISLRAFEAAAQMKLSDFSDYLKILADSTTDSMFKAKTCKMIRRQFITGDIHLHLVCPAYSKAKEMKLEQLLSSGRNNPDLPGNITFDSIRVWKALQRINDSVYSGQLRFTGHCFCPPRVYERGLPHEVNTVDIFVVKREKVFGRDSLEVWEVLLGDIKF